MPGRRPYHSECDLSRDVPAGRHHRRGRHRRCTLCASALAPPGGKSGEGLLPGVPGEFRQATLIWLFLLLFGAASCVNIILFLSMDGWMHYLFFPFVLFLVDRGDDGELRLPADKPVRNDSKSVIKNALIFSVAYLPRTALIVVINVFPWALLLTNLYMFLQVGFYLGSRLFCRCSLHHTRLLKKVFAPYMEPDEEEK